MIEVALLFSNVRTLAKASGKQQATSSKQQALSNPRNRNPLGDVFTKLTPLQMHFACADMTLMTFEALLDDEQGKSGLEWQRHG